MEDIKKEKLFSEFPPVTPAEWERKIMDDLKGADYENANQSLLYLGRS
jgi:hypothetical protein